MPPLPLIALCIRSAIFNQSRLVTIGRAPYYLIKPILMRIAPENLLRFEDSREDLLADTEEIWKAHVFKDFSKIRSQVEREEILVDNIESWRDIWVTEKKDESERLDRMSAKLRASYKSISTEKETKTAQSLSLAQAHHLSKKKAGSKRFNNSKLQKIWTDHKRDTSLNGTLASSSSIQKSKARPTLLSNSSASVLLNKSTSSSSRLDALRVNKRPL